MRNNRRLTCRHFDGPPLSIPVFLHLHPSLSIYIYQNLATYMSARLLHVGRPVPYLFFEEYADIFHAIAFGRWQIAPPEKVTLLRVRKKLLEMRM